MKEPRLSKAETRILEQYWKLGTASVREVLESLPEDERVAYTTVQTLSSLSRPSIKANTGAGLYGTCLICLEVRRAFSSPICWRMAL
jgi:Penicillinase repressor